MDSVTPPVALMLLCLFLIYLEISLIMQGRQTPLSSQDLWCLDLQDPERYLLGDLCNWLECEEIIMFNKCILIVFSIIHLDGYIFDISIL